MKAVDAGGSNAALGSGAGSGNSDGFGCIGRIVTSSIGHRQHRRRDRGLGGVLDRVIGMRGAGAEAGRGAVRGRALDALRQPLLVGTQLLGELRSRCSGADEAGPDEAIGADTAAGRCAFSSAA